MAARSWVMPAAIALLASIVWLGPATPDVAFTGLFGVQPSRQIGLDLELYLDTAREIVGGELPYRDFAFEYPPLSIPLILAPYGLGDDPLGYRNGFVAITGAMVVATAIATTLAARRRGYGWRLELAAGGLVALGPWLLGGNLAGYRLDMLPAMLVSFAAFAAAAQRHTAAGAMAGLGTAAKLWPGLVAAPIAALAARQGRPQLRRSVIAIAIAVAVPFGLAFAASPGGLVDTFQYHAERPLQIEALGATGLLVLDAAGLAGPYGWEGSFGSINLIGGNTVEIVTAVTSVLAIVAVTTILAFGTRAVFRAGDDDTAFELAMRTGLAATVALLAFGKVFSPQFLLWLLPLPLLVGRQRWLAAGLSAAIMVLTQVGISRYFDYALEFKTGSIAIFAVRDLLLLILLIILAAPLLHPTTRRTNSTPRPPHPRELVRG